MQSVLPYSYGTPIRCISRTLDETAGCRLTLNQRARRNVGINSIKALDSSSCNDVSSAASGALAGIGEQLLTPVSGRPSKDINLADIRSSYGR